MVSSIFWKNKKVFLTGHTGFKGSWLSLWLLKMGAQVVGFSKNIPTDPSLFQELKLEQDIKTIFGDVADYDLLKKSIQEAKPDIVIHMAAQPLVRYSYNAPVETYMTNVMGTVHLLNITREISSVRVVLNVTSDKCYENFERELGYSEDEPMGGYDPYSNSKGCSELVTSAFRKSFFNQAGIALGTGRAGNVIGGGDWAQDRLVPDIVRSVISRSTLQIRYPKAIRPWQHVLEPLSGYLTHVEKMYSSRELFSKSYNFGPLQSDHCDVQTILTKMNSFWNNEIKFEIIESSSNPHEAHYLKLNCQRAHDELKWFPKWNIDLALEKVVHWNIERIAKLNVKDITLNQIQQYESMNHEKN